jgi:DNA invertase Pin-like site-specific DNA recombinase
MNVGYARVSRQHQRTSTYSAESFGRRAARGSSRRRFRARRRDARPLRRPSTTSGRATSWWFEGSTVSGALPEGAHRSGGPLGGSGGGVRKPQRVFGDHHPGRQARLPVFASLAEFERDIIRERTMAGLEAARARGKKGGRKRVMDERKIALAARLMRDRAVPVSEVCEAVDVSRATLYRYLNPDGTPREERPRVLPPT